MADKRVQRWRWDNIKNYETMEETAKERKNRRAKQRRRQASHRRNLVRRAAENAIAFMVEECSGLGIDVAKEGFERTHGLSDGEYTEDIRDEIFAKLGIYY